SFGVIDPFLPEGLSPLLRHDVLLLLSYGSKPVRPLSASTGQPLGCPLTAGLPGTSGPCVSRPFPPAGRTHRPGVGPGQRTGSPGRRWPCWTSEARAGRQIPAPAAA